MASLGVYKFKVSSLRMKRRRMRKAVTVQGRFLETFNADDILFGNTFDRPLNLPWGSGAVFKFMQYVHSFSVTSGT